MTQKLISRLVNTSKANRLAVVIFRLFVSVFAILFCGSALAGTPTFSTSFSPTTIAPGGISTVTYTIDNSANNVGVSEVGFTNTLPTGMTIANPANSSTDCINGQFTAAAGSNSITFSDYRIGTGSSCTLTLDVTTSTVGSHVNTTGALSTSEGSAGTANATLTVSSTLPSISIAFSPTTIAVGGISTITYTIDNSLNGSNVTFVDLSHTLDNGSGLSIATVNNFTHNCPLRMISTFVLGSATLSSTSLTVNDAEINAGSSCTLSYDVTASAQGVYTTETGSLSSSAGTSGAASASLTVETDFMQMEFPELASPGESITLQYTITNSDRDNDATDITFTTDLNATLSGLTATALPSSGFCGGSSTISGSSAVTVSNASLASGDSCTFSLTLLVPSNAAAGTYTNNTSTINLTLGSATTKTSVSNNLIIKKAPLITAQFVDDPVLGGGDVTLRYTITNTDTANTITAITTTQQINSDISNITAKTLPSANSCGSGSTFTNTTDSNEGLFLNVSNATLAAGANCTFDFILTIPSDAQPGSYDFSTSTISATNSGSTVYGSAASDTLTVIAAPNLTFGITESSANPNANVTAEFTINYNENASADATGLGFTLDLDSALSGLVATSASQSDVCGSGSSLSGTSTLTFTGGTLSAGGSCSFSVTLQVPSTATPGTITATTSTLSATISSTSISSATASDTLLISGLTFSHQYLSTGIASGTTTLRYTIANNANSPAATAIQFSHDVNSVLSGLSASSLPSTPCGSSSVISGPTNLAFSGGELQPGANCTFDVVLAVPVGAADGVYTSTTSALSATVNSANTSNDASAAFLTVESLTVNLSTSVEGTTKTTPIPITISFSRDVTNFDVSDLTVSNGSASNLSGSGQVYTADITPSATGTVTVDLAANAVDDAVDNSLKNTAATQLSIDYDATVASPPSISAISAPNPTGPVTSGSIEYTITYADADEITLASSHITLNGSGVTADIAVSGSGTTSRTVTLSNLSGEGTIGITIGAGSARSNASTEAASASSASQTVTVDTVQPTITISSNDSALKVADVATLTFTLSETTSQFTEDDVSVTGGSLSNFSGSDTSYTASFTPTTDSTTSATINVAANVFNDSVGNANTAANQLTLAVDTIKPTISISSNDNALKVGDVATLTFTLSETSTDFASSDVVVTGGSLSNFSGSGTTYTASLTPTSSSTTNATVNVAADTFTDAAGNNNTIATELSLTVDTSAPTITITSNDNALKAEDVATITFTLSESSSDFTADDVTVTGGVLSGFSGSGTSYTASFTPTAASTTNATIDVAANQFVDASGNNNSAAVQLQLTVETVIPTVTISSTASSLKAGETAPITFTLSESSSDFSSSDISVTGGSLSNFTGSGTSYTATFTPTSSSTANGTLDIAADTFTDAAGNGNSAATQLVLSVDTLKPTATISADTSSLKLGETATLIFSLNETSSTFSVDDVTVTGGSLQNFVGSGTTYVATLIPTSNSTTAATVDIAADTFTDSVGNNNNASTQLSLSVDTALPSITISSDDNALQAGDSPTISFTLSEASTNFAASDIVVSGGVLSGFTGSGTSYSATFTPSESSTASATFNVAASTFTDSAGNANTAATELSLTVDTVLPSITISSNDNALQAGDTPTITFTLSETSTDFAASDIVVTGGALSGFSGSGSTYTASFTPTTNSASNATFNVAANTFADSAGNANTAATELSLTVDTILPSVTISSNDNALQAGDTPTISFVLSESSTDFTVNDVTVGGGALSNFSGSGTNYSATFTPTSSSTTTATFNIAANNFTDSAGNGNSLATELSLTVDTVLPTITIASNDNALQAGDTPTISFTLSEASTNFAASDIVVSGGALSDFTGSGTSYSATFTPSESSTSSATFNVAASTFTDSAGNANTAATELSLTVDTVLPSITISSNDNALQAGDTPTITFTLSETSADFAASDIVVTGGALSGFSGSGSTYTATFTPTTNSANNATFNVAANTFNDSAGNANTAATELSLTVDTILPSVTISSNDNALQAGDTPTISFVLSESSADFTVNDVTVVGGVLSNFSGSGANYSATFTPTSSSTTTATFNIAANNFTDSAGNGNSVATELSLTVDTVLPTITIASNDNALQAGDTPTISFTLSEASTNFAASDIVVSGGALSDFTGSGTNYSATFTPSESSTSSATFNVAASTFTDSAGNANTAATELSLTVDTLVPSISISSNDNALKVGDVATLTFTLSESSSNFTSSDISVTGGSLSAFSGSGTTYTASFTPSSSSTTNATIDVAASTFTDSAGNNNTAASQLSLSVDTTTPTISIISNDSSLVAGDVATLTFTLSESASNFTVDDIDVTGGSLSDFSGSGTSYSASFTPTTSSTNSATINVAASTFTDSAGNANTAATELNLTVDTVIPSIAISSSDSALQSGDTPTITFTLSESSSDFTLSDVTVVGGALTNFAGSGTTYTATFTPNTSSTSNATFNVAASSFTDSAGNANTAATELSLTVDTALPSIAITSDDSALQAGDTPTITFTLSESSSDFAENDIVVTGGNLSGFTGSGSVYTATFTPSTSSTSNATFNVAASTFTDNAGNANTAATQLSLTVDTLIPTIAISTDDSALKIGDVATLSFTLSESATNFTASDITVSGGSLTNFSGSGTSYTASFTPNTDSTTTANIDVAASVFTDSAGNSNSAASQVQLSVDTTTPTISITSDDLALKSGDVATLSFTLSESSATFASDDIVVTGGVLSSFSGSGSNYTATFTPNTSSTDAATVNIAASTFTDSAGNPNSAASQLDLTIDTLAPSISITSNDSALIAGETATLTFTLSEASSNFVSSDIVVTGGSLSGFAGSGTSYSASFTPNTSSNTSATVNVAASVFTDSAGNGNTGANELSLTVDTLLPTIAISSNDSALSIGDVATLTFTLSETSSDFSSDDITVVGGSLSDFSGSGTSYTASLTPNSASTTDATINVAASSFTDSAGNNNSAASQLSLSVDTVAPSIAISADAAALKLGEVAQLTFTISESVTGFSESDIQVSGGTLSNFSGSGTSYSATFNPAATTIATASIDIAANTYVDLAGNSNTSTSQLTVSVNTSIPTISIASSVSSLKMAETASLTFTLSEASTTFAIEDISVVGGSISDFSGSNTSYSATFTPNTDYSANATIDVAANTFTDSAGNNNSAANQVVLSVDTLAPTVSIATNDSALQQGDIATLTFTLSESTSGFSSSDITVTGGSLSNFSGSGVSYTASFTPTSDSIETASINVAASVFADAAGNNNTAADPLSITIDTTLPSITIASNDNALKIGDVATLTFTLSESSNDFTASDISVTGGTLSDFSGTGVSYSASFTPSDASTTNATINVAASRFTDSAGNNNTAATELTLAVDTTTPTLVISSNDNDLKVGDVALITFTLSEAASDFNNIDVTVSGGSLSDFSGSGSEYTANFTPDDASTANATISVAASTYTDSAGNNNSAADPLSLNVDTVKPNAAISTSNSALKAGEMATISFTLSENSSDFSADDINVTGGTLSGFSGSGTNYSAEFTPTDDSTVSASINIAANVFTDTAGNDNEAATALSLGIDTQAPSITISSNDSALKVGDVAVITFTLSESATDFTVDDVTVTNALISDFTGSGTSYSANLTPNSDSTDNSQITVAASLFTDAAGNANTASNDLSLSVDTTTPSIFISSDKNALKINETATLSFTLSEDSSDFTADDITVNSGLLANFSGSGSSYTATYTPASDSNTDLSLTVAASVFTDAAGNNNSASATFNISIDTQAPTISLASNDTSLSIGETASITFTLSETSSDFTLDDVSVTGAALSHFSGSGVSYTATLTPSEASTSTASINIAASVFTDNAGNSNTAAESLSIAIDTLAPTVNISSNNNSLIAGEIASLSISLSESSSDFTLDDLTVSGGTLANFSGSGSSYTVELTPNNDSTTSATVNIAASVFVDSFGNSNSAAEPLSIDVDTQVPSITLSINDSSLNAGEVGIVTFTLSEVSTNFTVDDISVAGGVLSDFSGSGTSYTANFTPSASATTDATIDVAANTFTDAAGNNNTAASQLNLGVDTSAPTLTIASSASTLITGDTATITFTLSEISTDFTVDDISVVAASLSDFTGSGTHYTATLTPDADSTTAATVLVAASLFSDAAGNLNEASDELSITVDTQAPSITITSNDTELATGDVATLTFSLSEASDSFTSDDIVVTGATLSDFTGSESQYTASLTPNINSHTPATISIAANTFTDTAGNNNTASELVLNLDTLAPSLTSSSPQNGSSQVNINGLSATLTFSENMLLGTGDITLIQVNDSTTVETLSSSAIQITDSQVALTFSATLLPNVEYGLIIADGVLTDNAGNHYAGLTTNELNFTTANSAPIASDDSVNTDEDNAILIDVLANDLDSEGFIQASSVAISQAPTKGSTSINTATGVITYTPNSNENGADSFTYTFADQQGSLSNAATVSITIAAINDAPVANNDTASTAEDTPITVDVVADDTDIEDGKPSGALAIVVQPTNGSAEVVDGQLVYSPAEHFAGSDTIVYQVSDSANAKSNTATLTISVTSTNDTPVATNDSANTLEDTAVVIDVLSNDADIEDTSFASSQITIVNPPSQGSATIDTEGTITYTPNDNVNGSDSFTYTVTDSESATSNEATVDITIAAVNDAPIAVDNQVADVTEDTVYIINVLGNDIDIDSTLDTNSVTIVEQPTQGSVNVTSQGQIEYTPSANYNGSDLFTYTVADIEGLVSNAANVSLTVLAVNDAPLANNDGPISLDEDSFVTIDVLANDTDIDGTLDETQVTISSQPSLGTVTVNSDGTILYTANSDVTGNDSFTYSVVDNQGLAVESAATVSIIINAVNDQPQVNDDSGISLDEDSNIVINVLNNDSDIDSTLDVTSVSIVTAPANGSATVNADGTITYTPSADFNGSDSLQYTVSDEQGLVASSNATVSINVNAINDAPVISGSPSNSQVNQDSAFSFSPSATDIDSTQLTFTITNQPSWLAFDSSTGTLSGTPSNADVATYNAITISVSDGEQSSDLTAFNLQVVNVNDAPQFTASFADATVNEDSEISYQIASSAYSDIDANDILAVTTSTLPSWLSFDSATLSFSGTPTNDDVGSLSLTVFVTDLAGASASQTLNVIVSNTNDAPTAQADSFQLAEGGNLNVSAGFGVLINDADIDNGDSLTAVLISQPSFASSFTLNADGSFSYNHNGSEVTTDRFTYVANDGTSNSQTVTVTLNLTAVNDQPSFTSQLTNLIYTQGESLSYAVSAFDADNQVAISLTSAPSWLSLSSNNVLSGTVPFDEAGNVDVTLTVSDGEFNVTQDLNLTIIERTLASVALSASWSETAATEQQALSLSINAALQTSTPLNNGELSVQLTGDINIDTVPNNCSQNGSSLICALSLDDQQTSSFNLGLTPQAVGDIYAVAIITDTDSNDELNRVTTDISVSALVVETADTSFEIADATSIAVAELISTSANNEIVAGTISGETIKIVPSSEADNSILAEIDNTGHTIKVFAKDFNSDLLNDVVAINSSGQDSALYINNGDNTFSLASGTPLGNAAGALALDYNGDSFIDLITFTSGQINFFTNSNGLFSEIPDVLNWNAASIVSIAFGDINGDGVADLTIGMAERLQVIQGLGALLVDSVDSADNNNAARPAVQAASHVQTSILDISALTISEIAVQNLTDLEIADIDNDGTQDLVVVNNTESNKTKPSEQPSAVNIISYKKDQQALAIVDSFGTSSSHSVEVSDLDNDGNVDLLVGNKNGVYQIYKSTAAGGGNSFSLSEEVIVESSNLVVPADIDGDNINDVVAYNSDSKKLNLYKSINGNFIRVANMSLALTNAELLMQQNEQVQAQILTISNAGPQVATQINILVNYDATAVEIDFANPACNQLEANQIKCSLARLEVGNDIQLPYSLTAKSPSSQDISFALSLEQVDEDKSNNNAAISLDINSQPIANIDSGLTAHDTAVTINVLANDSDSDNDSLNLVDATSDQGSVSLGQDTITFTPTTSFVGNAVITYTINDGRGGQASSTLHVVVAEPQVESATGSGGGTMAWGMWLLLLACLRRGAFLRFYATSQAISK
ncbi:hypothetical protein C2869_12270 [Saccharobesus litoralis]|uniref:Cadherin domain-containing protein n=1 Tax=Saccharobesus litoralis TaxID=2172099 RepID=A0A2S0VSK1_9ALTE|nr:Ig-like domain-containing protein [Saccharobesus litoralis]AWB67163.1 hypothetical protein C2869_12270 [Saccharobesus litoralis]